MPGGRQVQDQKMVYGRPGGTPQSTNPLNSLHPHLSLARSEKHLLYKIWQTSFASRFFIGISAQGVYASCPVKGTNHKHLKMRGQRFLLFISTPNQGIHLSIKVIMNWTFIACWLRFFPVSSPFRRISTNYWSKTNHSTNSWSGKHCNLLQLSLSHPRYHVQTIMSYLFGWMDSFIHELLPR